MDNSIKFVLACRYLYYCKSISYLEDSIYNSLETYVKTQKGGHILDSVSSDSEDDYSEEIKEFAQQLLLKHQLCTHTKLNQE